MAKTASRRHQTERIKRKRRLYWGRDGLMDPLTKRQLNIIARTPNICNCQMCRNPRRVYGNKAMLAREKREWEFIDSQEWMTEELNREELLQL